MVTELPDYEYRRASLGGSIMPRSTERKSNFELLRIVAMLMIVAHHLAVHGVQHVLFSDQAYRVWAAGSLANRLFTFLFVPGGGTGVAVFFMLTGYFLVEKQRASVLKVCLQTVFYGLTLSALFVVLLAAHRLFGAGYAFAEFSLVMEIGMLLRHVLTPVSMGGWWFVSAYVLLVLTAPRINQLLAHLNRRGFARLLLVTWFFWYSCQLVLGGGYAALGRAFFFYGLGAYCKRFGNDAHERPRVRHVVLFVVCWLAIAACAFCSAALGTLSPQTATARQAVEKCVLVGLENCILLPLCAWSLFAIFARMSVPLSRRINTVAATTFGVYLLHDSTVGRQLIWNGILRVSDVQFLSPYFPLLALADILAVFAVCSALDWLRLRFVEPRMTAWAARKIARIRETCFS